MEKIQFTRKELYEMVWSEPLMKIAKKYNITDNGLRRLCKKRNIPLPDNGYWLKLKYKKPLNKKPLPYDFSDEKLITLSESEIDNLDSNSPNAIKKQLLRSYESIDKSHFKVSSILTKPNKLIIEAQKKLIECMKSKYYRGEWLFTGYNNLSIKVFPENMLRALKLFDTIIKLLRIRNFEIICSGNETLVYIKDVRVSIALREKQRIEKVKEYSWMSNKSFSTGIF